MTCEEFHFYLSEKNPLGDKAAAEHLETCGACRVLSYSHNEVARSVRTIRDSAPGASASLDAAMMNSYRREMDRGNSFAWRRVRFGLALAAVTAGLVIGTVLLFAHRRRELPPIPAAAKAPAVVVPVGKSELPPSKVESVAVEHEAVRSRKSVRSHIRSSRPQQETTSMASGVELPETGFQNLMYCDTLSCAGSMQVIRIQVPASAVDRVPAWRPANGLVQADVVVGSDGIARAIRIVK